jgi:LEA14-like dessication related protein
MPVFCDPVVTLEDVRLRHFTVSSLDLEVIIHVENPNPVGITLRELPFTIQCSSGQTTQQLACGNTGRVKIARNGTTVLRIPVTSQNAALINAFGTFVIRGGVQVTILGMAIIDCILFGWSIPFSKTLPVTMTQVAESLTGQKSPD